MNIFLVFFNYFDALISKIILKKLKNIILMYFKIKNILKSNSKVISKHCLKIWFQPLVGNREFSISTLSESLFKFSVSRFYMCNCLEIDSSL
jgi:hypothetical protein